MTSPLERLLRLAENLTPSGVIGDGMVAEFHSLAAQVRADIAAADVDPGMTKEDYEAIYGWGGQG